MRGTSRIFHYHAGTINLCFLCDGRLERHQSKLNSFTVSDWRCCRNTRVITGGSGFFLAGGIISVLTQRQSNVSLSSTEAGYHAVGAFFQEIMWMQQIMKQMQYNGSDIVKKWVYTDIQSFMVLSGNCEFHENNMHIDNKNNFIWDHIASSSVDLKYVLTKQMHIFNTLTQLHRLTKTWRTRKKLHKSIVRYMGNIRQVKLKTTEGMNYKS